MVAATLPELLDDAAAWRFAEAGVPAIAGLRTGVAVAAALAAPPGRPARLGDRAAAPVARRALARGARGEGAASGARRARRSRTLALNEDEAVAAFELGRPWR